eukprot:TRINITY_DN4309_c0_g2_i1.p1 TRINITY_DN4309_c0_g2~~TRINITY_DN4309_c0_g2_i1.p1  ORF type:complete len:655 (-),score=184.24 TRINITY_DN4309_c0_g2_i1:37-1881(-)
MDQPATIVAIMDQHQQTRAKIENALELEKLKQDLELNKKLKAEDATKNLEIMIDTLKSSAEVEDLKTRRRSLSVQSPSSRTIAVQLRSSTHFKLKGELRGYLNKKSAIKNQWKRFWFILSKPYLYYYSNAQSGDEKVIDLVNSAVTPLKDEENSYCFGIVTWKRVWILQAASEEDKLSWMKAIDPNIGTFELKERVANVQNELEVKNQQIIALNSKLNHSDQELKQKVIGLQTFCTSLTKKLELLKQQLIDEQNSAKQKDDELTVLRKKSDLSKESDSEQVRFLKDEIESLRNHLETSNHLNRSQTSLIDNLEQSLTRKETQLQERMDEINILKENIHQQEKMRQTSKLTDRIQSNVLNKHNLNEGSYITTLKEELTALEAELIDKDYHTQLLNEKITSLEEQGKSYQCQLEQLNAKLKLRREELSAKDNLLNDKFTIKVPNEDQSFTKKLFGPSKAEQLEKQLISSKKASLAHQTHNAFLNMEISRLEKETRIQLKLREQSIDRLKKESSLLRKRLFNVSKEKGERNLIHYAPNEPTEEVVSREQFEMLKKKYFANYAVVIKMDLDLQGRVCNLNVHQLWEMAQQDGLRDFEDYPDWLNHKMSQASAPTPKTF